MHVMAAKSCPLHAGVLIINNMNYSYAFLMLVVMLLMILLTV